MNSPRSFASAVFCALLTVAAVDAQTVDATNKQPAADNTANNTSDRDADASTPMDQSNDKEAIAITAAIRRAVMDDKSLSASAHNVKIVTNGNTVTLRGPVASAEEKTRVEALAVKSAAGKKVRNEISISG